ncbi:MULTISPECIES: hypothetical protein [unclassified Mycolicibacterium]|uniref:hypothetical protein n=1 Tax=unclassified Mycolicibacterium TaxID=2636767 RepID=UPI0012DE0DD9|nr:MULTISPECIES: hypothetical protein [unclassified Mycolicibacterium]MUL81569.1 hypothetical protein [Mycolicibacterium sp. CBMA 329]MUL87335.1 hypothetical protein [Mycolicibacterium sp. CBMA 331]MUM02622.1 hypothetical protein [Mycolicibacterium sp. CBMA 334]MUM28933.1 hypothetical protein [Mycolicibacterium sp. CBMA 295]MUM37632.1 hypothetical protein [Mycolicibacterium sp. CBMA 247]
MTASLMTDTSVGNWMLPRSHETQARIERVVAQTTANRESARPLRTLGVVARKALADEIEAKLRMVLSETLADLIVEGWHTYGAITTAIKKSRTQRGVEQIVPLRTHVITANRQHNLDVEVDTFPVLSLVAKAAVRLQLFAAVAVVLDGHVVEIRSGQATADGTVSVDGVEVSRKTLAFPLEAKLVLRRPPQAAVAAG